jgi:hypothetical protein
MKTLKNLSAFITVLLSTLFTTAFAVSGQIRIDSAHLSLTDHAKVEAFVKSVQDKISPVIMNRVLHELPESKGDYRKAKPRNINVRFVTISEGGGTVTAPNCEAIDSMEAAAKIRKEYKEAIKRNKFSKEMKYEGQVHSYLETSNDGTITINLNASFLPIILAGETSAQTFACGHRNMYRLAQAAIVHQIARILDNNRFQSRTEAQKFSSMCAQISNNTVKNSHNMVNNSGMTGDKYEWSNEALLCLDLKESETLISEKVRYRTLAVGWAGKIGAYTENESAFWPRAVSKYAFAHDVQNHFAHTFEFFILDPTFECRLPNQSEFLVAQLSDGTGESPDLYQSVKSGKCAVNTEIRVIENFTNEMAVPFIDVSRYDLNPDKVAGVDYFRAGAGTGAASLFGHSMYRVRGVKPDSLVEFCEEAKVGLGPCDLILNHRANPVELRLDQLKGMMGGYPSQLLVSPIYDITSEYNDTEMRNIFSLPLGQTISNSFQPMPQDEKKRFLYAAVDQYWTYVGDYKFISNNCADEALRLYKNASNNMQIQNEDVLMPGGIDKRLIKIGALNEKDSKSVKEPGFFRRIFRKVFGRSNKAYRRERQQMENNDLVELSKRYTFYDAISNIIRLEGRKEVIKNSNGTITTRTLDYNDVNTVEKEANKYWGKLGTVSEDKEDICKINKEYADIQKKRAKVAEVLTEVRTRYQNVFNTAKAEYLRTGSDAAKTKLKEINESFYVALYHADLMRQGQLGDIAIRIAYEIARPDNGEYKEMLCKGKYAWKIEPDRIQFIGKMLSEYEEYETLTQPYSVFSLVPGYGIPLKNEVRDDGAIERFAESKKLNVMNLMLGLAPELGIDFDVYRGIRHFRYTVCLDRLENGLYNKKMPECDLLFEDVVQDIKHKRGTGVTNRK